MCRGAVPAPHEEEASVKPSGEDVGRAGLPVRWGHRRNLTARPFRADGRRGSGDLCENDGQSPHESGLSGRTGEARAFDIISPTRKSHEREGACRRPDSPSSRHANNHGRQRPSTETGLILGIRQLPPPALLFDFEAAMYLSSTGRLNTNRENWMVRWWIEAWRAGCSRSQRTNRTSLCPSVGPSGVTGREGLLTRMREAQKSRLCTWPNLEDNKQGHTEEFNTIWKYKTHNPRADRGDMSHVLILGSLLFM